MKVVYSQRAAADLRSIAAYHERSGDPNLGQIIPVAIEEVVARFAETPPSGRRVDQRPGIYVALSRRYRYLIFYKIMSAETIRILHIRHTSRRPWKE